MVLSANIGRSQGVRRVLSASSGKNKLPLISTEIGNINLPFTSHAHFCFELSNYVIMYTKLHMQVVSCSKSQTSRFADEFARLIAYEHVCFCYHYMYIPDCE